MADDDVTLGEIARQIQKLDDKFEKLDARFVSLPVYEADRRGNDDRHKRAEDAIRELGVARDEDEKRKGSTRLMFMGTIFAAAASVLGSLLLNSWHIGG